MGIIMMLKARAPANAEKCFELRTTRINTNKPMTIEGKPVNTSFVKLEIVDIWEEDHSEKNMPAPTPIGIEIKAAKPTIVNVPAIVLAMPPPDRRGPVGRWVKNPMLMAGAPCVMTSAKM
jgi:hypothetical protein